MIGLDTNVLVRYITQDDARQSAMATRLIESLTVATPGYVSLVSVIELVWLLQSCFGSDKAEIARVLESLLRTKELVLANADVIWKAVQRFSEGQSSDFADCLIKCLGDSAGCTHTATFDRNAAKHCGMKLVG